MTDIQIQKYNALMKRREHYLKIANDPNKQDAYRWLFHGKSDVLVDLLKMFEPLEP